MSISVSCFSEDKRAEKNNEAEGLVEQGNDVE